MARREALNSGALIARLVRPDNRNLALNPLRIEANANALYRQSRPAGEPSEKRGVGGFS